MIEYYWSQISVFTRQSGARQFVLFIDCPPDVVDRIRQNHLSLGEKGTPNLWAKSTHEPFVWHAVLVEELKSVYDRAVWSLRDCVRDWEKVSTVLIL